MVTLLVPADVVDNQELREVGICIGIARPITTNREIDDEKEFFVEWIIHRT